jgi:hypothetical protein
MVADRQLWDAPTTSSTLGRDSQADADHDDRGGGDEKANRIGSRIRKCRWNDLSDKRNR